jgi:hypothetical protein
MRQFIGGLRGVVPPGQQSIGQQSIGGFRGVVPPGQQSGVRDLLISVAPPRVREAAARLDAAELVMMERDDEPAQLRYASALAEWGDAGGYDAEVLWDACCVAALGVSYERCRWRSLGTLSGGEQKRLVLEALLRGPAEVLLLDEPDNYLDVPGKQWLEQQLALTPKTVLLVSHDRELRSKTGMYGCMAEGSPATPRPAATAMSASMNCAAGGTRNTRNSSNWCACTGRRRPTTRTWPHACKRR